MTPVDLPQARRQLISDRLAAGQAVIAVDLAAEFGLSEDAIRRDLRALAAEGLCRRVYGGAVPISPSNPPLAARLREAPQRKSQLARAGAATVKPGELIFIDAGSTNFALVEFLPEDAGVTVVTNAVDVAAAVLHRQDLRLIMLGGEVDRHLGGCVDAAAVEALRHLRIDRCFVGACALSEDGLSTPEFNEATFKRLLVANSRHCAALVTSDKLGLDAAHRVAPLSAIHTLVMERDVSEAFSQAARSAAINVIVVEAAA